MTGSPALLATAIDAALAGIMIAMALAAAWPTPRSPARLFLERAIQFAAAAEHDNDDGANPLLFITPANTSVGGGGGVVVAPAAVAGGACGAC